MQEFEKYLLLYKKLSLNTLQAYKKDITNFISFLISKGNQVCPEFIEENDYISYIDHLKNLNISKTQAQRTTASLKIFASFLHKKYDKKDYSMSIKIVSHSFPIVYPIDRIARFLELYKKNISQNYHNLRGFIIIYLLCVTKIKINQLISLKISNLDLSNQTIKIKKSLKCKDISLPSDIWQIIIEYLKKIPYKTNYLFSVKTANSIKPLSSQAVWALIRYFVNKLSQNENKKSKNLFGFHKTKFKIDEKCQQEYIKRHPRI